MRNSSKVADIILFLRKQKKYLMPCFWRPFICKNKILMDCHRITCMVEVTKSNKEHDIARKAISLNDTMYSFNISTII